jgi:hypothetical protein
MNGTNSKNTTPVTAFDALVNSAIDIRDALNGSVQQLNLAIEYEAAKRRTAKELRTAYEEAEAEFVAEVMPNLTGKNAESRKAELDAALVAARRDGTLANLWAQANAAAYDAEDAKVGLDTCAKTFHATEAAANLTAAILNAVSK